MTILTERVRQGRELSGPEILEAVAGLVDENVLVEAKADFLAALAEKGETPEEIAGFARALRDRAVVPSLDPATRAGVLLDVVGTGGDRAGTINLSTAAALVASAAGVPVAKHGNRAVTSQTGSADVLAALGIPTELGPHEVGEVLRRHGFVFFFAPRYHPAFRQIAPARKLCAERGQRTLFNFLGPLLNPARPSAQLMGVPRPELCRPLAQVLASLGVARGMVVCGEAPGEGVSGAGAAAGAVRLDELSTLGPTTLVEFAPGLDLREGTLQPSELPVRPAVLADLRGGDREENGRWLRSILRGEERGPKREAVLLNAAAALRVAGWAETWLDGWALAAQTIDSGRAAAKLEALAAAGGGSAAGR